MANDKKTGRPIANNVDYFPHKCKDDKELMLIQHKYKSEEYEAFYRLETSIELSKRLGHLSITTTEIYAKFSLRRLEMDFPSLMKKPGIRENQEKVHEFKVHNHLVPLNKTVTF